MVPPRPPETATGSERRVFDALSTLDAGEGAVALTSLNLSRHEYQRWGEIDFVLVMPRGLIVIEVKGGRISCEDGIWRMESRYMPTVEKAISPVAQASAAYFSLMRKHLKPDMGHELSTAATSGFCVLYPGMRRKEGQALVGGPEAPAQIIGFGEAVASRESLALFLSGVLKYWRAKEQGSKRAWSPGEIAKIVAYLRPSFDRVPPLSPLLAKVRDEQYSLTTDQYRLLDFGETAERMLCTGSAGCGKTFVAVECLRREREHNPLLVTGTEALAAHLRASAPRESARILAFDHLGAQPESSIGTLIVDEGQQLTDWRSLNTLSKLLRGGLERGRWRWFSDPNNQVSSTSKFDAECHAMLARVAVVRPELKQNCRNTPQIIEATHYMSGIPMGNAMVKGNGPMVGYAKGASGESLVSESAAQVKRWLAEPGIEPGHIAILSSGDPAKSSVQAIARAAGIQARRWHAGWEKASHFPREAAVASVEEFRGLEAPFVVLCDVAEDNPDPDRLFYLGMSRANFGLFVACTHGLRMSAMTRAASVTN